MSHYREVLYQDYSAHFGGERSKGMTNLNTLFSDYQQVYSDFVPQDKNTFIADLGCGQGTWLAWLKRLGYDNLLGIDVSAAELEACPDVAVEEGDILEMASSWKDRFDVLHAKDVFEHLQKQEVIDLLQALHGALKPGGQIWISTFNAQALFSEATYFGDFTHESAYSPQSITQVLAACGFDIVAVRGIHVGRGLKGNLRKLIWKGASTLLKPILVSRHGKGNRIPNVDITALEPDLLAVAKKTA